MTPPIKDEAYCAKRREKLYSLVMEAAERGIVNKDAVEFNFVSFGEIPAWYGGTKEEFVEEKIRTLELLLKKRK